MILIEKILYCVTGAFIFIIVPGEMLIKYFKGKKNK